MSSKHSQALHRRWSDPAYREKQTAVLRANNAAGRRGKDTPMASQQTPSVGRVVHYISASGAHRPAIIIDTLDHTGDDTVALYIFQYEAEGGSGIAQPVKHDETEKDHFTWHWPEFVPPATGGTP